MKYIVRNFQNPRVRSSSNLTGNINLSQSPQSLNNKFSSYINKNQNQSSKFVGLKIKFDLETSDNSSYTDNSESSVWEPFFKKNKVQYTVYDQAKLVYV